MTDGKPGHEKQSLGLARALAALAGAHCHDLRISGGAAAFADWLLGRFPAGRDLPDPDLILAAGHASHVPALAARSARGGRIVVLMRPSLPLSLFDLCLIPSHDRPPQRPNVVVTQGVLNAVSGKGTRDPSRGLILIGGPSRHYRWDDRAIAAQVRELIGAQPDLNWTLTTSRRTPASFLTTLGSPAGLDIRPNALTPAGWLEQALPESDQVWVSPDSVSMIYEALTAGCRVGLFQLIPRRGSRIALDINRLAEAGLLTPIDRWRRGHAPARPPLGFNEAERCARLILQRWYA
ncbi:MAG: mitochondrial fission ELM1 family protein [Thiobacillaceae bacterium]